MSRQDLLRRRAERQKKRREKLAAEGRSVSAGPTIAQKTKRYSKAFIRWRRAGYPVRPEAEAQEIYETLCCPCTDFDENRKTCSLCGCKLRPRGKLAKMLRLFVGDVGSALAAKTRMATEHCARSDEEKLW